MTDLLQLVMDGMGWNKQKAQLWFNVRNPLLGNITPNWYEMTRGKEKLEKFIRTCLSENKPIEIPAHKNPVPKEVTENEDSHSLGND